MNEQLETSHVPAGVKHYLDKYYLPGWNLELKDKKKYTAAVVIPALAEHENIKKLLISLTGNDPQFFSETLILFVINNTAFANSEHRQENLHTLEMIRSIILSDSDDSFINEVISSGLNIGLIDASSSGKELPEKDAGAGLARKIGMDLALTVLNYDSAETPFLVCLDADCIVEKNYITELHCAFRNNITSAYVKFEHQLECNDGQKSAIVCYEIYMRYYVLGLKLAGSHFAFHTVGSTMACNYKAYLKAEGMNKRKAGEDFYFMEKLGKISDVEYIKTTCVYPSSRGSWRVPFGTGQRVTRFLSQTQNEYLLYAFESFLILKAWLEVYNNKQILSASEYLAEAKNIHIFLYDFLVLNGFEQSWEKILKNSKTGEQVNKQKNYWFDGFRTMKFIHYLRDNVFPLTPMFDTLDVLFEHLNYRFDINRDKESIPPLEMQAKYLNGLKEIEGRD